MSKLTPPLNTMGRYTLKDPFVAVPNTLYSCAAIRTFRDIRERGFDPFTEFYEPLGLDRPTFEADADADVNIITLVADDQPAIYVPDSYILSYPNQHFVPYKHTVLSVTLGLIPDYLDLAFLQNQISGAVSDVVGTTPEVKVHVAPTFDALTPADHEILEVARQQAIALRTTDRARVLELEAANQRLVEQLTTLETIVKNNGLI